MSAQTAEAVDHATKAQASKQLDLTRRFVRAQLADPALAAEVPPGATLVLLPDDDPAHAEAEMALGLVAARQGRNVYFRHIRLADLPE